MEPLSLQDLGSAKHQAEMHTLALLILLHRLRTLDVDAIDPYVDVDRFDPRAFFDEHSRALTFEELAAWEFDRLTDDVRTLASAERPGDLLNWPKALDALFRGMTQGLFTGRKLGDYFNHRVDDPMLARRIINGLDRAGMIATYHRYFLAALP